ncbi:Zinc finger, BED-type predicted [Phytophthora cinnamomi]|uniref:Zinc finger, BED-type predicted n=1 Tax=Phytophthora cinnamomi TaxID=4785 RepID=UPI003559C834|nr:Zinc finger, BED-type predicted [Phytophthora cinnamomi]
MPGSSRAWMETEAKAAGQALGVEDAASGKGPEQVDAADVTTGAALFDLSSYTGGAPLIPMGDGGAGVGGPSTGPPTDGMFDQELMGKHSDADEKKMGRPSHPAWQFFVRGEKRNRFHHNAYCRFCTENGENPVAVRGVSGNMIRHLQKCIYCPSEVVTQLKLLCAQKDAANFNKRHQSQSRSVDMLLQETSPAPRKKARPSSEDQGDGSGLQLRNTAVRGTGTLVAKANGAPDTTGVDDFMPLPLPLLSSEMSGGLATGMASPKPVNYEENVSTPKKLSAPAKPRLRDLSKKPTKYRAPLPHRPDELHIAPGGIHADALNKLVVSSTVSAGLPWDWTWTEQSASMFGDLHAKIEPPTADLISSLGIASHEKQIMKMKDEQVGVTLAVNCRKFERMD